MGLEKDKAISIEVEQTITRLSLLEKFIDLSTDAIQVSDEEGRLVFINETASNRLGIPRDKASDYFVQDFERLFEAKTEWDKHVEELKQKDFIVLEGLNVNQQTGARFPAEITVRYLVIGNKGYVLASSRDITERKNAEQKLKESEIRLSSVLSITGEGVWDWNINSYRVWHNKRWNELLGFDVELREHQHNDFESLVYSDDFDNWKKALELAMQTGSPYHVEHRVIRKDGIIIWLRNQGKVIEWDNDGNPVRMVGSISDISQAKRYELELKHQHGLLNKLANQIPGMIYQFQLFPDGRMVFPYTSVGINEIYELSPEQAYNDVSSSLHILHPDDLERIMQSIKQSAESLENWQCEYRVVLPEKGMGWRSGIAKPERLEDGSVLWHGYIQDITERKRAEEELLKKNIELQKTNAELDRFVYSTSHDLRAPLMSVLGLINLSEKIYPDDNELKSLFYMMKSAVNRLDKTINNILDYSKNSRVEPYIEKIDIESIINNHIENIKYMAEANHVLFDVKVDNKFDFYSDKLRVTAVINNLITNAVKYQRKDEVNPSITIEFISTSKEVTLTISDNGEGIEENQLERIFEMFVRNSERSTGSGLGLYMCKEMVEKLGGRIQVSSVINKGSSFTVVLPNAIKPN